MATCSTCPCHKQVVYCLQLAWIPADIFSRVVCPKHSPDGKQTAPYIAYFLHPDTTISGSEKLDDWATVYHGTTVEVVSSIVTHGQLLMLGDVLSDGRELGRRYAEQEWNRAIFTNPERSGAEQVAATAVFDDGATQFKILVRLRQKPGTFEIRKGLGYAGYDLWSTNRRGTLYIEALEIHVIKSKDAEEPPPMIQTFTMTYMTSFTCPVQKEAFEVLKMLNIPQSAFDGKHNRCYCSTCYPSDWANSMMVAEEKYAIPRGWTRFGLAVNPVFAHVNDIWRSWPIAFHGCHPSHAGSIIQNRGLLIPHDVLPDGNKVCPNFESHKDKYYYLSPEVGYASHAWYAKPIKFRTTAGEVKYFQTIFCFKVRSDSFKRKRETEGGTTRLYDDYSIISAEEVEWYSNRRGCTHPYGLLIRIIDVDNPTELRKFFKLPDGLELPEHKLYKLVSPSTSS